MTEKNMKIQRGINRHTPEQRNLVLNRMGRDEQQFDTAHVQGQYSLVSITFMSAVYTRATSRDPPTSMNDQASISKQSPFHSSHRAQPIAECRTGPHSDIG